MALGVRKILRYQVFAVTLGQTKARQQKRQDKKVSVTNIKMKTQIWNMVPAIKGHRMIKEEEENGTAVAQQWIKVK